MDKNEREVQEALGQMKEYQVKISVPVRATVAIYKSVMAPTAEDAIENAKAIIEMSPQRVFEQEIKQALTHTYAVDIEISESISEISNPSPEPFEEEASNIKWPKGFSQAIEDVKMTASDMNSAKCCPQVKPGPPQYSVSITGTPDSV